MSTIRVGLGYDVHRLQKGEDFYLGGLLIDHEKGAVGHSDGDVLIHAVCDALLGAAHLGDIGQHFPDNDPNYKDIRSTELLQEVVQKVGDNGYEIGNIDVVIRLERPKISAYLSEMKTELTTLLSVQDNQLSIKATTHEGLGFVGEEKGVAAQAVVLIHSAD